MNEACPLDSLQLTVPPLFGNCRPPAPSIRGASGLMACEDNSVMRSLGAHIPGQHFHDGTAQNSRR